jgi:hypothetical protein
LEILFDADHKLTKTFIEVLCMDDFIIQELQNASIKKE